MSKIKDTDLSHDRLARLAHIVAVSWDKDRMLDYVKSCLFDEYQYDCDVALRDAQELELTLGDLDDGRQ
jgi:hypothetical protein